MPGQSLVDPVRIACGKVPAGEPECPVCDRYTSLRRCALRAGAGKMPERKAHLSAIESKTGTEGGATPAPRRTTWSDTRAALKEDRQRAARHLRVRFGFRPALLVLHPIYQCILLHRLSHYFWMRRWRLPARLMAQINLWLTGFDAHPQSRIGPGALILSPTGTSCSGHAGGRLTMMGASGFGFIPGGKNVGAGPGHPLIGDGLTLGPKSGVLGPHRVGTGVRVAPGTACMCDAPDGSLVVSAVAMERTSVRPAVHPPGGRELSWDCPHARFRALREELSRDIERCLHDATTPDRPPTLPRRLAVMTTIPMMVATIYRISHWLHARGWRSVPRMLSKLNLLLHKVTIPPQSCIRGGLFVPHPVGTVIHGRIGRDLTLYARVVIVPATDPWHAALEESPLIEDGVKIAAQTAILGPIRIGASASGSITAAVQEDVPPGCLAYDTHLRTTAVVDVPATTLHTARARARAPITWRETRQRLAEDRERLRARSSSGGARGWYPCGVCVWLHRVSHYLRANGRPRLAHLAWRWNFHLTGADIDPSSDIGGGLIIEQPAGVTLDAIAGRNLTLRPICYVGRSLPRDVTGPDDRPEIGDDVTVECQAVVCGAIRIGDRALIAARAVAIEDLGDDEVLRPAPPRIVRIRRAASAEQPGESRQSVQA